MSYNKDLEQRRIELLRRIETIKKYRDELIRNVNQIKDSYAHGIISYEDYKDEVNKYLKGRSLEEWKQHYDNSIKEHRQHLEHYEESREKVKILPIAIVSIFLLLGIGLWFMQSGVVGLTVYNPGDIVNDTVNISLENITYDINTSLVRAILNSQQNELMLGNF